MTGRERILTVLNGGQPDRVPTAELDIQPNIIESIIGKDDLLEFVCEMDMDGMAIWQDRRVKYIDEDHFIDDFGTTRVDVHIPGEYPVPVAYPIETVEDAMNYKMPSPHDERIWQSVLKAVETIGKTKCVIGRVRDVFSFPRDAMGYTNFLINLIEEPEMVSDLMAMSVEYSTAVAAHFKEMGIEVLAMCDDIATAKAPLVSPTTYREQILPHFKQLITNCHDLGLKVIKHTDGNLKLILDDLISSGIDCLDPIDPMGGMDMGEMKQKYGDRLALMGNIDCVGTLVSGSLEDVENEVKACIKAGGQGGGLIVASSNSIHKGVKPENYCHMLKCIKKYGVYPLNF